MQCLHHLSLAQIFLIAVLESIHHMYELPEVLGINFSYPQGSQFAFTATPKCEVGD